MESWVQSWRPRANAFCDFSSPCLWSIAPATKKWCQVIQTAAPVTQNHLPKTEDLLQNASPLRKSAPWPPNVSDEHVSCTGPATENASFQILFKCPTPAINFEIATKPSPLWLTFHKVHNPLRLPRENASEPKTVSFSTLLTWKCASRHNNVHFFDISTSNSAPNRDFLGTQHLTHRDPLTWTDGRCTVCSTIPRTHAQDSPFVTVVENNKTQTRGQTLH